VLRKWLDAVRQLISARQSNQDLLDEIACHVAERAERLQREGLSAAEAQRRARLEFGAVATPIERSREARGVRWLDGLVRNVRFALRTFRKRRGAYVFAMVVLALGIGMTTALFSLVHAVLLSPLPFSDQDSLRVIWKADTKNDIPFLELAYPELKDLEDGVDAFESVALMPTTPYGYGRTIQPRDGNPVQVDAAPVTPEFFRTLGIQPALGRDFLRADDPQEGLEVILSDRVWRQHFSGDERLIGRQIDLDGRGHTMVGVLAPGVGFPQEADLWVVLGSSTRRGTTYLQAIARVRPGYSDEQVSQQVGNVFAWMGREFPEFYSPTQQPVIATLTEYWTGSARSRLMLALGAAFLLLIAACITASNLLVSRALARKLEIATRTSLGATSSQIFAQFAAEGLATGAIAGMARLAIAWVLVRFLIVLAPAEIPRIAEAGLDLSVMLFAGTVSLVAAMSCSVTPTWMASRLQTGALVREGGGRSTSGQLGRLVQGAFSVAQSAATVVLLTTALLIAISFHALLTEDIGFANRDAVAMNLTLRGWPNSATERDAFYTELLAHLRDNPAVVSAGALLLGPLQGTIGWDMPYRLDLDSATPEQELPMANFQVTTDGYFNTVGMPMLRGRDFDRGDDGEAERVAVISRSMADKLQRMGKQPLGSRIQLGKQLGGTLWTVVGVVANGRYRGVGLPSDDVYVSYLQTPIPVRYPVVRGNGSPKELIALVQREADHLHPGLSVAEAATIGELVERDTAQQRFNLTLLLVFAGGALLLAGAGVYSVVAEGVSDRRKEIAIRVALGAGRLRLMGQLVVVTLGFVVVGLGAGFLGVFGLRTTITDLLYETDLADPLVLGGVAGFLLLVSVLASIVPAWRATGQEPRSVLQGD
jgi:putative ABC transport system permease protein